MPFTGCQVICYLTSFFCMTVLAERRCFRGYSSLDFTWYLLTDVIMSPTCSNLSLTKWESLRCAFTLFPRETKRRKPTLNREENNYSYVCSHQADFLIWRLQLRWVTTSVGRDRVRLILIHDTIRICAKYISTRRANYRTAENIYDLGSEFRWFRSSDEYFDPDQTVQTYCKCTSTTMPPPGARRRGVYRYIVYTSQKIKLLENV